MPAGDCCWWHCFIVLPLVIDAAAICVLIERGLDRSPLRDSLLARWIGESANSLMPAGQLGGPVLMARHLAQRGLPMEEAAAAITVSTTLQTFAQIAFALLGVVAARRADDVFSPAALRTAALIASAFLAIQVGGFYLIQRRGLFSKLMQRGAAIFPQAGLVAMGCASTGDRSGSAEHLSAQRTCDREFCLELGGLDCRYRRGFLDRTVPRHARSWRDAFVLESLGQAIRGAGFAIPGALGVQEGGYLLLAPLAGLAPNAALALSLAKRARELLLGLPGLLYLRFVTHDAAGAAGAARP